jgi:hypothetical protein
MVYSTHYIVVVPHDLRAPYDDWSAVGGVGQLI